MKTLLISVTIALFCTGVDAEVSINICETQSKGSPCNITCHAEGIRGQVDFYKDGSLQTSCHTDDKTTNTSYKCIGLTNETILVINSLMRSRDGGFWACAVNGKRSEQKLLQIYDMSPSSLKSSVTKYGSRRKITLRDGSTTSLDLHLKCVYPKPEVSVFTDDPKCTICERKMAVSASGSTNCNTMEDENNYNTVCELSWESLVRQDACKCQRRRLLAEVHLFNTSLTVDLNRELDVLDKTECGKLTGFSGIEILPLLTFFVATVVLVSILCKTSYHYLEIQSSSEYVSVHQLR